MNINDILKEFNCFVIEKKTFFEVYFRTSKEKILIPRRQKKDFNEAIKCLAVNQDKIEGLTANFPDGFLDKIKKVA